jgi:2-polyprenyl-3-methyl-5-hydroxy-6-metoxy-1,4-benzoquinol methylase
VTQRSFRDPAGFVFVKGEKALRLVEPAAAQRLLDFLSTPLGHELIQSGRLIQTRVTDDAQRVSHAAADPQLLLGRTGTLLEHPALAFPSYPHEWPAEALVSAGELTLDLARSLLDVGLGLKDATPHNVLLEGTRPVFVDVLSIEAREPGDPTWLPYGQFVRSFLLPLLVHRRFGIDLRDIFLTHRDGIEPEGVYALLGFARRLLSPWLGLVSLPTWLGRLASGRDAWVYRPRRIDRERAHFLVEHAFARLRRALRRAAPRRRASAWSAYDRDCHYAVSATAQKERFVVAALDHIRPARVLDVGCNTGRFSFLAARRGARVVAIDSDPVVVGEVYRAAARDGLDVLPLVVDLARPTPAVGWRGAEDAAFLARAEQHFDLVLLLAVVHHLVVTERIPIAQIVELTADLTRDAVLVEFVGREDPMFVRLLRGRDELHRDWSRALFEEAWQRGFTIEASEQVEGGARWLYRLRKRRA